MDYPIEQMMRNSKYCVFLKEQMEFKNRPCLKEVLLNPGQYNYNIFKKNVMSLLALAKETGLI
jgi:hypothetical protein